MSVYRKKVFPLHLPNNFHGQQAPKRNLIHEYNQKRQYNEQLHNPQFYPNTKKIVNWQLKRNNNHIAKERRQYLTHVGKTSSDLPYCFQTTNDFYRRNQALKLKNSVLSSTEQKAFDVFNRKRVSAQQKLQLTRTKQLDETFNSRRFSMVQRNSSWNITQKPTQISWHQNQRSTSIQFFKSKDEVTPKIGSVEVRDFSVKKPLMKIGKTQVIDTYSPF